MHTSFDTVDSRNSSDAKPNLAAATWLQEAISRDRLLRRRHSRFSFRCPATFDHGGMEVLGMSRDISRDGIGFLHHECAPKEGPLDVTLWINQKAVRFEVDVRWVKDFGNGWWASGGPTNETIFGQFYKLRSRWRGAVERRIYRRFPCCMPFELQKKNGEVRHEIDRLFVLSLDISRYGMSLLSPIPQRIGDVLYLRPTDEETAHGRMRAQITRCSQLENSYYEIGVEFTEARLSQAQN